MIPAHLSIEHMPAVVRVLAARVRRSSTTDDRGSGYA
jgi:hypothetical protein